MINRINADAQALREETIEIGVMLAPGVRSMVRRTHVQRLADG